MGNVFSTLDLVVFFAALAGAMVVGFIAGRHENTTEDYFLAGRKIPWWGVAASIFGSNVSANHMVGMMGAGFAIGFAQSHFELGAIAGLMLLCYGFLPVYRKLNLYTLSEYLARRYDERSRVAYAIIMIVLMAVVQMVPALYIGSRSFCILLGGDAVRGQQAGDGAEALAEREAALVDGENVAEDRKVGDGEITAAAGLSPNLAATPDVNMRYYVAFVIALAVIAGSYTIVGGLKAVVWTDVIQSVLLLAAGIVVALLAFAKLGGWHVLMDYDAAMLTAADDARKMHLYLPMNHPDLPWTGMLTGLMAMHFFYWGTNQFIVQRALAARSDSEARLGIVAAGFLKLTIPFFSIATGAAAFYLFKSRLADPSLNPQIHQDVVFVELVKIVAAPIGFGLMGLIAAGVIGAILSSIDSMMNSAATIITIDIYRRYIRPQASDRELIVAGRISIALFVILATLMAVYVINPNSKKNFFLQIVDYQGYLTPGLLVAFLLGMFWKRGTATAAIVAILAGIVFSGAVQYGYDKGVGTHPVVYSVVQGKTSLDEVNPDDLPSDMRSLNRDGQRQRIEDERRRLDQPIPLIGSRRAVVERLGPVLNFFHRVVAVLILCAATFVVVSLMGQPDTEKGRLVWTDLGGHDPGVLRRLITAILVSILVFAILGWVMYSKWITPTTAALLGSGWTLAMFVGAMIVAPRKLPGSAPGEPSDGSGGVGVLMRRILGDDRLPAGILSATAIFLTYYFY